MTFPVLFKMKELSFDCLKKSTAVSYRYFTHHVSFFYFISVDLNRNIVSVFKTIWRRIRCIFRNRYGAEKTLTELNPTHMNVCVVSVALLQQDRSVRISSG